MFSSSHTTHATAPSKLILSGEHAVVYGQPALATAIDLQVRTTVHDRCSHSNSVSFSIQRNTAHKGHVSRHYCWKSVQQLARSIWRKHALYCAGKLHDHFAIQDPFVWLQVILVYTLQKLHVSLSSDIHICVQSHAPIGCGLGSSASCIVSVMHALAHHFGIRPSTAWYYKQAVALENLQHIRSSGIDPYVCLHGGCHLFQNGQSQTVSPPLFPLVLVHTGTPCSCTGQCVLQVRRRWQTSDIWSEFAQTTRKMHEALQNCDLGACQQAIRRNHRLLTLLGVVPKPVEQFIAQVQQQGAAAKICGAGSTQGDKGGMVWILAKQPSFVLRLCQQYGYSCTRAFACMQGAQIT